MTVWRPWPYAATAIVQHEWDTNLLNVWVVFRHPMDQTVKPAHNLWLCEADGVPKAITVSAWQDEWTILLTVPNVLALPGEVTLEYDGPDSSLRTTWDKQWEPWGPILSRRIPYLWEDILVVDTVLKRVGIQPGLAAAAAFAWALTIVSPDGDQQTGLYHDNSHTQFKTTIGWYIFQTDEGTNTNTNIAIRGKGTGVGALRIFNPDNSNYLRLIMGTNYAYLGILGTAPVMFAIQNNASTPVSCFIDSSESEIEKFSVYGWKAGDTEKRHVDLQVSPNANNTALWSGVGDYVFDGNIRAVGRLVSGTLTTAVAGPTDNLDVSGVNTVFIDCSGGDVIIGGFVGGVDGQTLSIVRLCAAANNATLEHNEAHAFQKIFLHVGLDETLTGEYGGWTLVCNGTSWFDASHAKHV